MAATSNWYGPALAALGNGTLTLDASTTLKAALVSSSYTPDADHQFLSSITGELTGSGYARVALTTVAVTYDTATNRAKITADPIVFASMSGTFRYLVIFNDTGTAGTSALVKWTNFTTDQSVTSGTVTATPDAAGLGYIAA